MKKIILYISMMMLCLATFAQQRSTTTTYPYNGLLINPAYAGSLNLLSVIAVHRKQWINVEGAPTYTALSANSSFASNRIGLGVFASKASQSITDDYSLYGSYAYKINTSIGILAMGLQGGFNQRTTDYERLNLLSTDPLMQGAPTRFSPNFGTGIYLANPVYYIGASVPYIVENIVLQNSELTNSDNLSIEKRHYYLSGGFIYPINDHLKISPGFLLKAQEAIPLSWNANVNIIVDEIAYIGLNYRNVGDFGILGQLVLNENLRVGYAYDINTSAVRINTSGSHEIFVNYRIKLKNYKKDPQCPVYF
jgi:type IX secretion system PorP/SprF family membrane protein|tara:strand:- start:4458 stop:5381 length:924 start_codon:yes stop_codon:yes gene_type:complete